MTRDQAEEIWMANQVGMFHGNRSELAEAVLILSQDNLGVGPQKPETAVPMPEKLGVTTAQPSICEDEEKHGLPWNESPFG